MPPWLPILRGTCAGTCSYEQFIILERLDESLVRLAHALGIDAHELHYTNSKTTHHSRLGRQKLYEEEIVQNTALVR